MDSRNSCTRIVLLNVLCILLICNVNGFVKRDVTETPHPNVLDTMEQNLNQFRKSLDQSLAALADQADVKRLQPIFDALGDQLNRFAKAFEILTSPQETSTFTKNRFPGNNK